MLTSRRKLVTWRGAFVSESIRQNGFMYWATGGGHRHRGDARYSSADRREVIVGHPAYGVLVQGDDRPAAELI